MSFGENFLLLIYEILFQAEWTPKLENTKIKQDFICHNRDLKLALLHAGLILQPLDQPDS